jgi:inosose dehydratase
MSAWRLAYHANCWGPLGGDAVGVTSVAQLTYRTFGDMARAAHDIVAAGYEGIELFDGNVLDGEAEGFRGLRATLDATGLKLVAVYSGANFIFGDVLDEELDRIRRAALAAGALGAEHLVVGGGAKRAAGLRDGDFDALARGLDQVVTIARAHGLRAHYHPHLSTIVEGPEAVRRIFALTAIGFCPDTAHLAAAGGAPAEMVREHAGRIGYVHLKGWQRQPFAFTPIDQGDCDNGAVLQALIDVGYRGWITNELDAWPDPSEGARRGMAFVNARMPR